MLLLCSLQIGSLRAHTNLLWWKAHTLWRACRSLSYAIRGRRASGGSDRRRDSSSSTNGSNSHACRAARIMASLITAFAAAPQAVLAACAKGFQKGHGDLCGGAMHFAQHSLLGSAISFSQSPIPSTARPEAATGDACLLRQTLQPLQHVQQWLADTLSDINKPGVH